MQKLTPPVPPELPKMPPPRMRSNENGFEEFYFAVICGALFFVSLVIFPLAPTWWAPLLILLFGWLTVKYLRKAFIVVPRKRKALDEAWAQYDRDIENFRQRNREYLQAKAEYDAVLLAQKIKEQFDSTQPPQFTTTYSNKK